MTTKQLKKYADNQLKNYDDVFFFVNTKRIIKPYAHNGEKYGICYNNTYNLIASANNIDEAKEMIDDFVCREQEMENEVLKYSC
jgi:hypothetical protein